MRTVIALLLLSGTTLAGWQNIRVHQSTDVPVTARFQIVQSPITARDTFRVDRFTGRVWQQRVDREKSTVWHRIDPPPDTPDSPNQVNYQVFMSGITVRDTFLMNIHTGACWILTKDNGNEATLFWALVKNEQDKDRGA